MPKMYSLYSPGVQDAAQCVAGGHRQVFRQKGLSLAANMVDDGIKLHERSRINENGIQRCRFTKFWSQIGL